VGKRKRHCNRQKQMLDDATSTSVFNGATTATIPEQVTINKRARHQSRDSARNQTQIRPGGSASGSRTSDLGFRHRYRARARALHDAAPHGLALPVSKSQGEIPQRDLRN
jgi:hypothetical protein